jgi:hypothetical protein
MKIQFVTYEEHIREQTSGPPARWLMFPAHGLSSAQAEELADYLAGKLGWFTWYVELP